MNKPQLRTRATLYAEAYIAWVSCVRWSIDPKEWSDYMGEGQQFTRTVKEIVEPVPIGRLLTRRLTLSSQLASAMYGGDFRVVFQMDSLLRELSERSDRRSSRQAPASLYA